MTEPRSTTPSAGWYTDPAGSGGLRYWDGAAWTEQVRPAERAPEEQAPAAAPRPAGLTRETGFFRSLFDLSFAPERVVTIKFARLLYLIVIAFLVLTWLGAVIGLFIVGAAADEEVFYVWGVLHLIFGWIVPFLSLVLFRVVLEAMIAQIRTAQQTAQLVRLASADASRGVTRRRPE